MPNEVYTVAVGSKGSRVILSEAKDRFRAKAVELPRGIAIPQSLRSFRMTTGGMCKFCPARRLLLQPVWSVP